MYCQIALLSPPYSTLSYASPSYLPEDMWETGMRVAVPLGNSAYRVGIITQLNKDRPADIPKDIVIRPFIWSMEKKSLLNSQYMDMVKQLALRQLLTEGRILGNVLPAGMRTTKNIRLRQFQDNGKPIFYKLRDLGKLTNEERSLLGQDYLADKAHVLALAEDAALSERILLATDPPWRVRSNAHKQREILDFLMDNGSISRRQFMQKMPDSGQALNTLIQNSLVKIQALEQDEQEEDGVEAFLPPPMPLFSLNDDQQRIFDTLYPYLTEVDNAQGRDNTQNEHGVQNTGDTQNKNNAEDTNSAGSTDNAQSKHVAQNTGDTQKSNISQKKPYTCLLHGVTGSGKTAIYLELAKYCMEQGKSVLLLAPEVAIALKLRQDAELRNMPVTLYHGYQSPRLREKLFRQSAEDKEPRLIVGTRSALFLPVMDIGLIILDEEHDDSFKQDEGLPYHAKDIAWYRMQKNKGLFLMGSATPDIKSFYASGDASEYLSGNVSGHVAGNVPNNVAGHVAGNVSGNVSRQKSYIRLEMKNRIGNAVLPEIQLIDIKECKQSLAPESVIALKECLSRGDQAIIMLNRRGYAPLLYCLDCNTVARCPHCDIALAYHKKREQMTCHYCGYHRPFPSPCTECKALHFLPMGEGTERLEEDLNTLLSYDEKLSTKILRLDRDSTRREGRMEEILNAFAKQEAQILVGTQMLSKGHHFPNVTLALIADADLGLNFPDYRAAERTFQLLTQASGRAGRGEKKGTVLIQTRDTNHYCWDFIRQGDYNAFYAHELALREKHSYPPFIRLALIRVSWAKDKPEAQSIWAEFVRRIKALGQENNIKVMGPSPAPISFLQGRFRFQCLLKGHNWNQIRQIFSQSLPADNILKKIDLRISLDIDPVNML